MAGFAALSKSALDAVGDFEQLKGGIETLFGAQGTQSVEEYAELVGKSVDEVRDEYKALMETQEAALDNANKAYKTAGLSANEYMGTVTGFAASLKQSLGEEGFSQLADYADKAVIDMADNANKMGTSMESIQTTYQGFAKQNYTMLDNLKLGYGGTKEEMERLLRDAEELAGYKVGTFDLSSFADIVDAIHIVQDELGITGTTAKEASSTIQGSVSSMKAAWVNFLAGSGSVSELVDAVSTAADVIVTNLEEIIPRLAEGLPELAEKLGDMLPELFQKLFPPIINGAATLIRGLVGALPDLIRELAPPLIEGLVSVAAVLIEELPAILEAFASAIIENGPMLVNAVLQLGGMIVEMFVSIWDSIINGLKSLATDLWDEVLYPAILKLAEWGANMVESGKQIAIEFVQRIIEFIQDLPETIAYWLGYVIAKIAIWSMEMAAKAKEAGIAFVGMVIDNVKNLPSKIAQWLLNVIAKVISFQQQLTNKAKEAGKAFCEKLINAIIDLPQKMVSIGANIVSGIWNGISSGWSWLVDKAKNLANSLFNGVKDALGIHSPSTKFRWLGEMCVAGMDEPLEDYDPYENLNKSFTANTGVLRAEFAGTYTGLNNSGTVIDYDRMGVQMKNAMAGMTVSMDGQRVGKLVAQPVNAELGRINQRRT